MERFCFTSPAAAATALRRCVFGWTYITAPNDVLLGVIGGASFYMSPSQFAYWKNTQLTIDVVPGMGGMFSLENGSGKRFLTRSRVFTDDEVAALCDAA